MVKLNSESSLQFEVLELTNLPVAPEVLRESIYVKIKIGKDGDWSTTRAVKTGAANFKLSEDQDNKLLLHFPGVEKGERATVVVQAWEARSGAPDELLGTNTVDISKIIGESKSSVVQSSTVLVRLKEAGGSKAPRGEAKIAITVLPPLRKIVRTVGHLSKLIVYRDALVDKVAAVRNLFLAYSWGYVKGPVVNGAKYAVSNRKMMATTAATAATVVVALIGIALAILIPVGLIGLITFPLWIIPVVIGAVITSPVWIPLLIVAAIVIGAISLFILALALTSPPIRSLFKRFVTRFRESDTGKKLLFAPAPEDYVEKVSSPTKKAQGGNGNFEE